MTLGVSRQKLVIIKSYVQTDATTPNMVGAKCLTGFKLCTTTPNNTQQATACNSVCKWKQHVTSNNVASVYMGLKITQAAVFLTSLPLSLMVSWWCWQLLLQILCGCQRDVPLPIQSINSCTINHSNLYYKCSLCQM